MAKFTDNLVLDAALDEIAKANALHVCVGAVTTRAAVITASKGNYPLTPGAPGADFAIADDTSGRKLTVTAQTGGTATGSGDVDHIALIDGTNLYAVATCTPQTVVASSAFDVSEFKINLTDPT